MVTTPPSPQPSDTVHVTINGRELDAPRGMLLVEAAKLVGIDIPVFCYEPRLKPVGACRMCLVQIEKLPRLQTACTTPVGADMVVHTDTPDVIAAQNGVIELLLANHPLDCPICDKGGECPLQDNTFSYGKGLSRFTEDKRHKEKAYPLGDRIVLDRERCIMCYRCVRFHQEIPGDEALAAISRGVDTEIGTPTGEPFNSLFAGNTIELCPVGALTSRQYRFKARPWDLVRTPSVCSGCAVGCNIEVHSRAESVLRLVSRRNPSVDDGWLCDRGRFETVPAAHADRPTRPMVREGEGLVPTTWARALERTVEVLGSQGSAVASSSLSNEAYWILQSLSAKLPVALWPGAGTSWPVRGSIAGLSRSRAIVLVGLDAWNDLPVLALWIRRAVRAGAALVVLGESNGLWRDTTAWLRGDPATRLGALLVALRAGDEASVKDDPDLAKAVSALRAVSGGAVSVLAHPALAEGHDTQLEALASSLGADGSTGLVGAPLLGANGQGALALAPDLVRADMDAALASPGVLLLGDERWTDLKVGSFARLVLATSQPIDSTDSRVEVVLPMAHAYERQGSITNLEGRLQHQEGGAAPPPHARADWSIASALARTLGVGPGVDGQASDSIEAIRAQIASTYPHLAMIETEEALVARV